MRFIPNQFIAFLQSRTSRRNVEWLVRLAFIFFVLIGVYSVTFHYLMLLEDRDDSWISGLYWTFTTMSTLGLGDITFTSDVGKIFTIAVQLSGMVFVG